MRRTEREYLRYQRKFFNEVLMRNPDHEDVLSALADVATRLGHYRRGLFIDSKLAPMNPSDPLNYYNLACDFTKLGRLDRAFEALETAIALGYRDFSFMDKDPDLESLRKDARYGKFRRKIRKTVGFAE